MAILRHSTAIRWGVHPNVRNSGTAKYAIVSDSEGVVPLRSYQEAICCRPSMLSVRSLIAPAAIPRSNRYSAISAISIRGMRRLGRQEDGSAGSSVSRSGVSNNHSYTAPVRLNSCTVSPHFSDPVSKCMGSPPLTLPQPTDTTDKLKVPPVNVTEVVVPPDGTFYSTDSVDVACTQLQDHHVTGLDVLVVLADRINLASRPSFGPKSVGTTGPLSLAARTEPNHAPTQTQIRVRPVRVSGCNLVSSSISRTVPPRITRPLCHGHAPVVGTTVIIARFARLAASDVHIYVSRWRKPSLS